MTEPVPLRDRAARREALLDAADRIVRRDGPVASMATIAAEAGITKPILYRHFGDKSGLYAALADRYTGRLLDDLRAALEAGRTRRDRVALDRRRLPGGDRAGAAGLPLPRALRRGGAGAVAGALVHPPPRRRCWPPASPPRWADRRSGPAPGATASSGWCRPPATGGWTRARAPETSWWWS